MALATSNTATVTVNVAAVNDAPVAINDTLAAVEDTPVIYTAAQLLGNDTDVDGNRVDDRLGDQRRPAAPRCSTATARDVHAGRRTSTARRASATRSSDGLASSNRRP